MAVSDLSPSSYLPLWDGDRFVVYASVNGNGLWAWRMGEPEGQGDACGCSLPLGLWVGDASPGQTIAVSVAGSVGRALLQDSAALPAC